MKFQSAFHHQKLITFCIIITGCFIFINEISGIGFAPIRNFSRQTYGAGSQNWNMTQDARGRVYFGNRDGLLMYDGSRWTLLPLPNYTTVRSVFADTLNGRIYAGGSGEFGYFESRAPLLRPEYISLSSLLPKKHQNFSEIWNIMPLDSTRMVFQGDYEIFIADGNHIRTIPVKEKITASNIIASKIFIGLQDGTLITIDGHGQEEKIMAPALKAKRIVGIHTFESGKVLLATAFDALYIYDGHEVIPYVTDISDYLKSNQIFSMASGGDFFVFGTVNGGAVVKNFDNGTNMYINKDTGLADNTVLGSGFDDKGNLWLCLDNGIAYSMIDSPVYNLLGNTSEVGAGYASLLKENTLYIGTNRGLFSLPYPIGSSETAPTPKRLLTGQVWSIDTIGQKIFFSTDNGVFTIESPAYLPTKMSGIQQGVWYVAPITHPSHVRSALASTYHGFYLLTDEGNGWIIRNKLHGYDDAGGRFIQDKEGYIWLAHWIKGIYRMKLDEAGEGFDEVKLFSSLSGLPNDRDNSIFQYDGEMRFNTASGEIFRLDADGRMVKDDRLSTALPLHYPVKMLPLPGNSYFAFSPRLVWKINRDEKGSIDVDSTTFNNMLASSLIAGFESVGIIDSHTALVSHQEGFFGVDLRRKGTSQRATPVYVEKMMAGDSLIFASPSAEALPDIVLPYSLNSLTFYFASPEYRQDNAVLYSYRLDDFDHEWSAFSSEGSKEYTRLGEGKYTFRLKAFNTVTGTTSHYDLQFRISPPWYRSTVAKIIYALLILAFLYAAYRGIRYFSMRNAEKIRRQKEEELERMRNNAEREALQKDYEIAALKSESLEQDIKHKSSELSNITMNVIRKNEILLDISSKLDKMHGRIETDEKTEAALRKEVEKIQQLIRENISHDDDWKRFNQNFDIVYADFTKTLSEIYPDLTVSELRLCCYLKMGLSSKEIAPLLSISSKSVEMNRYRLRKKMGLGRETNLQAHLQKI